jgi:ABC-type dipeptide/oligopeptide/nickel transport system ATPase subunit
MAKITAYIPEPTQDYDVNNQRQILEALNTIKNQLNFGYQQDLINQQNAMTQFIYGTQAGSFAHHNLFK